MHAIPGWHLFQAKIYLLMSGYGLFMLELGPITVFTLLSKSKLTCFAEKRNIFAQHLPVFVS